MKVQRYGWVIDFFRIQFDCKGDAGYPFFILSQPILTFKERLFDGDL